MRKFTNKALAGTLSLAMILGATAMVNPDVAEAKKVSVKKVSVTAPSGKTAYVAKGKKISLTATVKVSPNKSANKKVSYKSANKKVATVNGKGRVKGVKAGSTKITVTSKKNSKKKATIKVVVKSAAVKKVKLDKTISLSVGGKKTLKASVSPKSASNKVVWTSNKKKVATVSSTGLVKGKAEGTAKITAKAADGSGKKAVCTVNVGAGIADVKVPDSQIITVSLTSPKALTADNFTVQTKPAEKRKYVAVHEIEKVRTLDGGKTYELVLENSLYSGAYLKVSVNALKGENTKEMYLESIADYGYEADAIERETGRQGESYSSHWSMYGVESSGYIKYSVTGLPAGLKAYYSKDNTSVQIRGVFTNVENGTTAVLTGVDEKGKTFKKSYVFYVGSKKQIVGNVLSRTVLSYTPDDRNTKANEECGYDFTSGSNRDDIVSSWASIAGGSGSYEYSVTGLPAAVDTMTVEGNVHYVQKDEDGEDVKTAIPAGTYNAVLTVKDRNDASLSAQFPFTITVTDGVALTGSVKDATGAPVKYTNVYGATRMDAYGYRNYFDAYTKADGTYATRVIPGDYYTTANDGYDLSISNKFTGPSVKDFALPLYKVSFTTTIAGATAYETGYSPEFVDAYGRTYSLRNDEDDYSLYAYMRPGTYEMRPATGNYDLGIGYNNTVYAYTKVSTRPYKDGITSYLSWEDRVGERAWQLSCAPFTVGGPTSVQLTGAMLPEYPKNYWD